MAALPTPWPRTLRALWKLSAPVLPATEAPRPFIAGHAIHLPPAPADASPGWTLAAAAHAGAHLVYSPPVFDGRGLKPLVRALVGLLEDARVEALAGRELPGLKRLWAGLHSATPADGEGVDALLPRLARALADPAYDDPHAWVRKGTALFYADAAREVLALPHPASLRHVASLLGNDLGQMRLQFNARGPMPGPSYRDDQRWMWATGSDAPAQGQAAEATAPPAADGHRHPEWDERIARLRPAWCSVHALPVGHDLAGLPLCDEAATASPALQRPALPAPPAQPRRSQHGPRFDLPALLRSQVARRMGRPMDPRVHRAATRSAERAACLLLVDASASSAQGGLQAARAAAAAWVQAQQRRGMRLAVWGFRSAGRHDVRIVPLLDFDASAQAIASLPSGLAALRPGGSTRLGAVLRHATQALRAQAARRRLLLVLSDGEPHDIDVHDRRLLPADARHAVLQARRQGIEVTCLVPAAAVGPTARNIFDRAARPLSRPQAR